MLKRDFYQSCYAQTGWLPMQPLTHPIANGDVCQIHLGRMQPLLNIASIHLLEPILTSGEVALAPAEWGMSAGVRQTSCENLSLMENDERRHCTRQILAFDQPGSFAFHAIEPRARWLLNWNKIKADATLKLTQLHYSFRHIYVVTAVATMNDWALAVAGQANAHLEMTARLEDADFFSLLSHTTANTERSKGLAYLERGHGRPAHFFKAKKLVISDALYDHLLFHILEQPDGHRAHSMLRLLDTDPLNLLKANELNLTTAIEFFNWTDFSLDDVACLGA